MAHLFLSLFNFKLVMLQSVCRYCGKMRVICVFGNVFNPQQPTNQLAAIRKVLLA